ncbi:mechanosensitive ion channel family protein [Caminibacter mediatlanticus]|uniref:mechanosensitive ion channel family protein n=1 Tax=Caminibacter mediatlanticus TaxID=291048 RepID=UPI000A02B3A7|nr:mechanosensitive ion channel family protein [Caminibacter mediatlanticus]
MNTRIYIVIGIILLNILFPFLAKHIKYFLFKKRRNTFLKLLYSRVYKIGIPLLLLIDINAFFWYFDFENFKSIKFFINLFLLSWLFYEVIKYFIYTAISIKVTQKKRVRRELFHLIINLAKVFIALIVFVSVLSFYGVNITAIITSLGIGGVIIGLAAKDTLSNFFDSIRLISSDAIHVGDWIETRDFEGFVTEIGLTYTQIRTFDNSLIVIPNTKLANDWVRNWSRRLIGRRIKFWVKIKYTLDIDEVNRVINEIRQMLISHPMIVTDRKIETIKNKLHKNNLFILEDKYGVRKTLLVYLDEFDEYSMNILVYAFSITIDWEGWLKVKQDVLLKVLEIIKNSKLELAYPTSVIFHDERKNLWKE